MNRSLAIIMGILVSGLVFWAGYALSEPPSKYNEYEKNLRRRFWDGRLTKAKSGYGYEIPDEGSSEGRADSEKYNGSREYFIPTHEEINRMFDEVERDEITNVAKIKDYATEALIQFPRKMVIGEHTIESGYYLAYLGDHYSGSKKVNMGFYDHQLSDELTKQRKKQKLDIYSAVILKKQGAVVAAFPINRREPYERQKGQRKAKRAFAQVEESLQGLVLKIYYRNWIYLVNLSPYERPIVYPPVTQAPSGSSAVGSGSMGRSGP